MEGGSGRSVSLSRSRIALRASGTTGENNVRNHIPSSSRNHILSSSRNHILSSSRNRRRRYPGSMDDAPFPPCGHPSASEAPSIAAANGVLRFRMSERPKGASSEPAVRCEKRRESGAAGRLRGTSGFAYFCRAESRSHQLAKRAAKRLLIRPDPEHRIKH